MAFRPSMGGIGGLGALSDASVSGIDKPMNTDALIAHLVEMTPDQRKQFASMHADDPMMLSAAKYVDNKFKQDAQNLMARQSGAQPPVNQQAVAGMAGAPQQPAPQQMSQGLPEETGIGALPVKPMQHMAAGGIVAFGDGGDVEHFARGGNAGSDPFGAALVRENVTDPRQIAFLRAIYGQESSTGKNTKTSNRGAVGGMQIKPDTFNSVADEDMDINDPVDNARGGIRYALQGYQAANGNPALAAAYYYGGPSGMQKAVKGQAVSDPKNPKAPNTLSYGQAVAKRMADLLPIGSAQAETLPPPKSQLGPDERVVGNMVVDKFGIPIRAVSDSGAPSPAAPDTRGLAEKAADYVGVPQEFQRNFSNTLNALGGWSSPVTAASRAAKVAQGLEASPEMVANAAAAAQKVAAPRLAAPVAEGIAALTPEAQAMRAEAVATKQAAALKADQQAAQSAQQSVDAANKTAQIANRAAKGMDAADAATAAKAANAADIAKGVAAANILSGASGVPADNASPAGIAALTGQERGAYLPEGLPAYEQTGTERGAYLPEGLPAYQEEKTAAPAKNPNEWTADDWLALAAGLGQNKSQYFTEALGGGLQNLVANRALRRKYDMENLLNTAHANQLNALTEAYGPRGELALARAAQLGNAPNAAALKAQQQSIEFQVKSAQSDLAKLRGSVGAMYDPDIKMQMAKLQSTIDTGMQRLNALQAGGQSATMPEVPAAPSATTGWGQAQRQ